MRHHSNFQNEPANRFSGSAGERAAEPCLNMQIDSAGSVSEFLKGAIVDRFVREREICANSARESLAQSYDEEPVELRVLPSPDIKSPARGFKIPAWKRILDLVIIFVAWPIWFPVMVLIMLAIKLTSSGPVFYRQERVGYRGRRFMIFKFRTMKVDVDTGVHESHFERLIASDSPMTKLDSHGDPRLIRGGRFLRAAGLDELPQILNVLRGEMSLVGARPCTPHEFERYQPWQRDRVNGPPGLTGYWQVNGKNKTTFSEMIEMDIFYGKNMSLRLDFQIMFWTIPAIIGQVWETRGSTLAWKSRRSSAAPSLS